MMATGRLCMGEKVQVHCICAMLRERYYIIAYWPRIKDLSPRMKSLWSLRSHTRIISPHMCNKKFHAQGRNFCIPIHLPRINVQVCSQSLVKHFISHLSFLKLEIMAWNLGPRNIELMCRVLLNPPAEVFTINGKAKHRRQMMLALWEFSTWQRKSLVESADTRPRKGEVHIVWKCKSARMWG